jgi:uncharacterized membrane protein (UPF0182 family)
MGYLAVDSNAGSEAGVRNDDYGKLRMLVVDADTTIPGPGQVQNTFNADPIISSQINLLKQGQSEVLNGNLLTLPVGGGLLYVQPVFVQASSGTQLPQLQKVLVAFGNEVAFEDTLNEALDALFGGDSGADTGDADVPTTPDLIPDTETPPETGEPADPDAPEVPSGDPREAALQEASEALVEREAALQAGDWAAYGVADERLTAAIEQLLELEGE